MGARPGWHLALAERLREYRYCTRGIDMLLAGAGTAGRKSRQCSAGFRMQHYELIGALGLIRPFICCIAVLLAWLCP